MKEEEVIDEELQERRGEEENKQLRRKDEEEKDKERNERTATFCMSQGRPPDVQTLKIKTYWKYKERYQR